jgi:ppGpp synthetase/RelA/SpoT-type nucleotidyltranferase
MSRAVPSDEALAPERFSKKTLRRLADQLREAPAPESLDALQRYKDAHWPMLMLVLSRIHHLPFARTASFTARQKNTGTILEKLRREPRMELARLQDIVGVRAVVQGGRREQADAVQALREAFHDCNPRVSDRLAGEHAGYRAIHVVVKQGHFSCEIQVRTPYQNQWAQLFEGLGDRWGREIRYGQPPRNPPPRLRVQGVEVTPSEVIEELHYISDEISEAECFQEEVEQAEVRLGLLADGLEAHGFLRAQRDLHQRKREVHERFGRVDSFFEALSEVVPEEPHPALRFSTGSPGEADELEAFLVAYRRSRGQLLEAESFSGKEPSLSQQRRRELEQKYQGEPDVEVVLLLARSEENLRKTHSRYFERLDELATRPDSDPSE